MSTRIGRFQILDKTSDGPIGAIYRANDPVTGRIVAVETARLATHLKPELREKALREARAAGSLNHPNIAAILDVGLDNESVFITREFVDGRTLEDFLAEHDQLDAETVLPWLEQIAAALDHAHQRSVVHGRLNPSNVLFTKSGQIKLTGFGVARIEALADGGAKAGVGSRCYQAPEQVKGESFDRHADIFALGTIAFEMLTGACPFETESVVSTIFKVVYEPAPAPTSVRPDLLPGLDGAVLKALEKNPADRYQSCAELYTAIRRIARPNVPTGPLVPIPSVEETETGPDRFCDQCGVKLVRDARFCFSCGAASIAHTVNETPYAPPVELPTQPVPPLVSSAAITEPIGEPSPRMDTPAQPFGSALSAPDVQPLPKTEVVSAASVVASPVLPTERSASPMLAPVSVPPPLSGYARSAGSEALPPPGADLSRPEKRNAFLTVVLPLAGFLAFLVLIGMFGFWVAPLIMNNPFKTPAPEQPAKAPVEQEKYPGPAPFATQVVSTETTGVEKADNATGPPDATFATVAPGGTLVVTLNSGYLLKDDGTDAPEFSIIGFASTGTPTYTISVHSAGGAFVDLGKTTGFSAHDLKKAKVADCDGFKIVNTGTEPFQIDSVQLRREPEPKASAPAQTT